MRYTRGRPRIRASGATNIGINGGFVTTKRQSALVVAVAKAALTEKTRSASNLRTKRSCPRRRLPILRIRIPSTVSRTGRLRGADDR
jgi:hypothetical protein